MNMKRLILFLIFCLTQTGLLLSQAVANQYIPPESAYKVENHMTIDQPYNFTWDLAEKATVKGVQFNDAILKVDKNKNSGIIEVVIKGRGLNSTGNPFLDCGKLKTPYIDCSVYPIETIFEIQLISVSNTETSVKVNLKKVMGRWESVGIYRCSLTEQLKDDAKCISTGEYERSFFNNLRYQLSIIKRKEEKKKREEELRLARELKKQRREQERQERQAKRDMLLKEYLPKCNGTVLSLFDFIMGKNPYADKGKCTMIQATTFQMTSEKTGLFSVGNQILYIEFPQTFRGPYVRGIAKIKGVYTYPTTIGTTNTVPHLQVIMELSGNEYYLLEK